MKNFKEVIIQCLNEDSRYEPPKWSQTDNPHTRELESRIAAYQNELDNNQQSGLDVKLWHIHKYHDLSQDLANLRRDYKKADYHGKMAREAKLQAQGMAIDAMSGNVDAMLRAKYGWGEGY